MTKSWCEKKRFFFGDLKQFFSLDKCRPPLSPCWDTADLLSLLFLPVQSSLFTLVWAECFDFAQRPKRRGGVNNFSVTLVLIDVGCVERWSVLLFLFVGALENNKEGSYTQLWRLETLNHHWLLPSATTSVDVVRPNKLKFPPSPAREIYVVAYTMMQRSLIFSWNFSWHGSAVDLHIVHSVTLQRILFNWTVHRRRKKHRQLFSLSQYAKERCRESSCHENCRSDRSPQNENASFKASSYGVKWFFSFT